MLPPPDNGDVFLKLSLLRCGAAADRQRYIVRDVIAAPAPSPRGAFIYDVCTGREEGGTPKADAVRKLSKGGCLKMQTSG